MTRDAGYPDVTRYELEKTLKPTVETSMRSHASLHALSFARCSVFLSVCRAEVLDLDFRVASVFLRELFGSLSSCEQYSQCQYVKQRFSLGRFDGSACSCHTPQFHLVLKLPAVTTI